MSAETAQREPTMEEILASIRRIISEEDRPAESGGDVLDLQPPPAPEAKAPPAPEPRRERRPEPVFSAPTPSFDEPEEVSSASLEDDLMVVEDEVTEVDFTPGPAPASTPRAAPQPAAPKAEWRPIEQDTLTSELLKPMLKQWLDANLPQIVEAEVAKEIDRIRRMAR